MIGSEINVKVFYNEKYRKEWGPISKGTVGSSGYDLKACIMNPLKIKHLELVKISVGINIQCLDPNFEAQIRPRSSMGAKGIIMTNSFGTIDSDYTGELFCLLMNLNKKPYIINPGDRIAQLVFCMVYNSNIINVSDKDEFNKTIRGDNGIGSTGR